MKYFITTIALVMMLGVGCNQLISTSLNKSNVITEDSVAPVSQTNLVTEGVKNTKQPKTLTDNRFPSYPDGALAWATARLDLDDDGSLEEIQYYKINDNIGERGMRTNEHLVISTLQNKKWVIVKHDISPNDNVGVEMFFDEIKPVNFGGKSYIFVSKIGLRSQGVGYYLFGDVNGKLDEVKIDKAYLNVDKFISDADKARGCKGYYRGAGTTNEGIVENFDFDCSGDYNPRFKSPEGLLTIIQEFKDGKFIARVKNLKIF